MQTFKEHSPAILGIAVLVLLASTCRAQATASISGTVHDVTGAVVPGANVVAINEANKARWTTTSNGLGFFSFSALQPATYTLRVTRKNFETWYVTGIVVHPGDDLTVPKIALKVGATDVTVTVTANLAGVTLNSPEHSTLITSGDIDRLSTIGRDVDELLATQPGFTLNAGTDMQNEGPGGLYGYQTVGPGSGQLGSWGAGGAAPQQGMVSLKSDGANLIDPGDMGGQMSNVNMDQVQEVKISTSNFGADQSNGPIVIDAVGKTGSTQYHGGIYSYFRNRALNSNDWLNKYYGNARPGFRYAYPGGTLGGPVMIPHTNFATKKNLVFWAGMEVYRQLMPESLLTSFVPSSSMIGGNLSSANIAQALNVSETDLLANCSADYSVSATYNPAAGFCWSPNGSTDATGNTVSNGQLTYIDPGIPAITSLWPQANRTPQPVITGGALQYATDAVNYTDTPSSTHNGFQFHTSEDYSMTDTLKLHVVYNWERVNDEEQENNIYYNPGNTVPFPTQMYSYGHNQSLSLNLTKVVGSSLTNELVAAGVYYYQPDQFGNPAKAQLSGTAWEAAGYTAGNPALGLPSNSQIPRIITYDNGIPGFSFGFIPQPPSSQFLRKFNWSLADNLTKVYRTHTFKIGYYMDRTGNNNINLGSQENGTATFMRWDTCYINQPYSPTATAPVQTNLGNVIGNFLNGCPLGFSQDTSDPIENLRFASMEGYGTDEWKVSSKLTLTLGMRFSHLDPWTDAHGIGLAVWKPLDWMNGAPLMQHTVYSDTASNATWPGISWHKRDPSIPLAGVSTRPAFYSARLGMAYDLFGNGKTVLRGGWGAYHSHDAASYAAGLATAIGLQTYSNPSTVTCTFAQIYTQKNNDENCGAFSTSPNSLTPFNVSAMDPTDDRMPVTYNYNFTIDQQGPWGSTFEIAYVGNQSSSLATLGNLQNQNVIPLGAEFNPDPLTGITWDPNAIPNTADYRPYPNYQSITVPSHIDWANYHSLQAQWNKQRGALNYGANYTFSKSLAVRGNWDTGSIADPVNPHHDYGVTSYDRPQAFNVTYSYLEGVKFHGNRLFGQIVNGWGLSGVTSLQSGPDLGVLNGSTNFGMGGGVNYTSGGTTVSESIGSAEWLGSGDYTLQPVVTCNLRSNLKKDQYVNGNCLALPPIGTQGWWNLPNTYGPKYFKSDLTASKHFALSERQNIEFRLAAFNFLNHPLTSFNNNNLGSMSLSVGDCTTCSYNSLEQAIQNATITNASTFGSTGFKDGVRIVEAAFKYNF